jgi:hypothetical protein
MRSDLLRRICRLEAGVAQQMRGPVRLAYTLGRITDEQRAALAPGERVVKDWCACSNMLFVRDRITTDPDDMGQRCGNRAELPDEDQPRSGESDDAGDQQVCWHDEERKRRETARSSPEASVTATSPA